GQRGPRRPISDAMRRIARRPGAVRLGPLYYLGELMLDRRGRMPPGSSRSVIFTMAQSGPSIDYEEVSGIHPGRRRRSPPVLAVPCCRIIAEITCIHIVCWL